MKRKANDSELENADRIVASSLLIDPGSNAPEAAAQPIAPTPRQRRRDVLG